MYTIDLLNKKYGGFLGPAVEVKVAGVKLEASKVPFRDLTVDLAADGSASSCSFTVEGLYDHASSSWASKTVKNIKIGAKLEVYGGYVDKSLLFFGYIDECSWVYGANNAPQLTVRGVDGLGYLMSCREDYYGGGKTTKAAITEILQKCVSKGVAKSVSVSSKLKDFKTPLIKEEGMDDYRFLRVLAERYGMVLTCAKGELKFDDLWDKKTPIILFEMSRGLLRLSHKMCSYGQVGKVEIWSVDNNYNTIKGTASQVSLSGSGKTAAEIFGGLKTAVLTEKCEFAQTKEECDWLAQARLNGIAMDFLQGHGACIGIPELVPGEYLRLKGLADNVDRDFYISRVRHQFSDGGYHCQFELKGAKA